MADLKMAGLLGVKGAVEGPYTSLKSRTFAHLRQG